jgi:hypothetical protein
MVICKEYLYRIFVEEPKIFIMKEIIEIKEEIEKSLIVQNDINILQLH